MADVFSMESSNIDQQCIRWMWKANPNPWSSTEAEEWRDYSHVETCMIEEAYQKKLPVVLLDDYHISFTHHVQISNNHMQQQRPVKRLVNAQDQGRLQQERFSSNSLYPSVAFTNINGEQDDFMSIVEAEVVASGQVLYSDQSTMNRMLVEDASRGLIIEGKQLGQQKQAEWMAERLLRVKDGTAAEIGSCCARLYCMDSFLFRKLNEIMRLTSDPKYESLVRSKVDTLGPFATLLWYPLTTPDRKKTLLVYRGGYLPEDHIEQYRQKCVNDLSLENTVKFPSFTSTSRNKQKAEFFSGNVLYVLKISACDGRDVSMYSVFDEEEELLLPNTFFHVRSCNFDEIMNKWVIYLESHFIS